MTLSRWLLGSCLELVFFRSCRSLGDAAGRPIPGCGSWGPRLGGRLGCPRAPGLRPWAPDTLPGSCLQWFFAHRLLDIVPRSELSRSLLSQQKSLCEGSRATCRAAPWFSQVCWAGFSAPGLARSRAGRPPLWLSGDCGDFGVRAQGQVQSYSAVAIGASSFLELEATAEARPVGCVEELWGHRRRGTSVRAARPADKAGPLGPRPAHVAQMCRGCQVGGPRACSSAGRAGLGPLAQDGKCPLTVASLLWGLVSRAYC